MKKGFGLVEVLVASAIIGITFFAIVGAVRLAAIAVEDATHESRAGFLLDEGIEVAKLWRDTSWSEFYQKRMTVGETYYLIFAAGTWTIATVDPGPINGVFTRTLALADVCRDDVTADIVGAAPCSGGSTIDPGTRQVQISVSWNRRGTGTRTKTVSTYVANIFQN
ncbi:prepilin-type N-terminal cleavage/methylation domain-containing protein [Candidatus Parcubacteria bacterium]|nr:MAG: prepilin-type N-terminal cleavage/methylation domain-containing protein [Candidatus Parcubacteria bacterium]